MGNESASGSKNDCGVELVGWRILRAAYPCGTKTLGKFSMDWGTGENIDFAPLMARKLQNQVG